MTQLSDNPELREFDRSDLKPCALCGHGMAHAGAVAFYELTLRTCILDAQAIMQQHGLETMMGKAAPLAAVFAPTTRVAYRMPAARHLICARCALDSPVHVLQFLVEEDQNGGET